jgi:hypothetical protein
MSFCLRSSMCGAPFRIGLNWEKVQMSFAHPQKDGRLHDPKHHADRRLWNFEFQSVRRSLGPGGRDRARAITLRLSDI